MSETVTAMFVLGVLLFMAIPVVGELKAMGQRQTSLVEAGLLLQQRMEKIRDSFGSDCVGEEQVRSRAYVHQVYRLRWHCFEETPGLVRHEVEIRWRGPQGEQVRRLSAWRAIP
ncbi:hypothetical protein [Staphylospora marina]|uniref:hypothetical protein n=1 Tax=Staphylospora marina TaxID=2490858 RepID=UPI000F5BE06F|nr:hypothetical protein [Staphylospora marina]